MRSSGESPGPVAGTLERIAPDRHVRSSVAWHLLLSVDDSPDQCRRKHVAVVRREQRQIRRWLLEEVDQGAIAVAGGAVTDGAMGDVERAAARGRRR